MAKHQGLELQLKLRSIIKQTREGKALTFGFRIGFLNFFVIACLPEQDNNNPLVYVKCTIGGDGDWEVYKDHGGS